jgi:hypothetical protein
MGYTIEQLQGKIMEMYPEIEKYRVNSTLTFDPGKKPTLLR